MSRTPPAVTALRKLIREQRALLSLVGCSDMESGEHVSLDADPNDYRHLWDLWRSWLPLHGPPPPPPAIRTRTDAHLALDSLLRRLDELFGPVSAEETPETCGGALVYDPRAKQLPSGGVTSDQPAHSLEGASPAVVPGVPAALPEAVNGLHLDGTVWHVRFEENAEASTFGDRSGSVFRHLARLLAEPNRRFQALEFYPPPPGAVPLPDYGRDASADDRALKEAERKLNQLAQEIKEADDAHDTETAERLKKEFNDLMKHVVVEKGARRRGHKKQCGSTSPKGKADQALRVGLERAKKRFREKGMPKLADHLDKYLNNSDGEWYYTPPPESFPWHVILPDTSSEN